MTNNEPTVYIVDDDQGARDSVGALVRLMGARPETFASAEDFLRHFDPRPPGCLVTDLRMLGMSGIELQEQLTSKGIPIPVIIITAHAETSVTVQAVKNGAVTVLEKPCRDHELYNAIRDALAQDARVRSRSAETQAFSQSLRTLSQQEQAVLDLMIEGVANKVIARQLGVSVRTVENRRQQIFEKTGAGSVAELVRSVVECGGSPRG